MNSKPSTEALKSASDLIKQIISLCTVVLSLTVVFADKFNPTDQDLSVPLLLKIAWGGYVLAIICGVWALGAVTGTLNEIDRSLNCSGSVSASRADVQSTNIRFPSLLCVLAFAVSIALTAISGSFIARSS